jgi:hypothetical protein
LARGIKGVAEKKKKERPRKEGRAPDKAHKENKQKF